MKKNYIFTLLVALLVATSAFGAKQPIKRAHLSKGTPMHRLQSVQSAKADGTTVLLSEDFSLFTAGSETTPDATDIADAETGEIPATYTQIAEWYGYGVFQAGGTAYMGLVDYGETYGELPGYIATPLFDGSNTVTIKFKARSKAAEGDVLTVYTNWYDETAESFDYDEGTDVSITGEWAEYSVEATAAEAYMYFDIYGATSEYYIDDVTISYEENGGTPGGDGSSVFFETFGENGPTSNPRAKIGEYTDYDNGSPVVFSVTTTDYPDIRATSTLNTHVWFPANRETDLVISNISVADYADLKLSFDLATNAGSANVANANVNKVTVEVNDVAVTVPSGTFTAQNAYVNSGEIAINPASTIKLRFLFTVANNPTNFGYRLDNIKITGTPPTGINTAKSQILNVWVTNGSVRFNAAQGETVEVYNAVGQKLASQSTVEGQNAISLQNKGVTIIKIGSRIGKVIL
ncbi:MAG: hypothetical protein QM751_04705 [Paludibacteraceae bacterium]